MHSMPAVATHPSSKLAFVTSLILDKFVAFQSLDNQILIYAADGNFRQNKKKRFAGHTVAGYACNIGFSPDGKFISSGTGSGDVVFWDWKTGRITKRLKAHNQVVIDHVWLPNEHVGFSRAISLTTVQGNHGIMGWIDQAVVVDVASCMYCLRTPVECFRVCEPMTCCPALPIGAALWLLTQPHSPAHRYHTSRSSVSIHTPSSAYTHPCRNHLPVVLAVAGGSESAKTRGIRHNEPSC